jgi:hypothetical protein
MVGSVVVKVGFGFVMLCHVLLISRQIFVVTLIDVDGQANFIKFIQFVCLPFPSLELSRLSVAHSHWSFQIHVCPSLTRTLLCLNFGAPLRDGGRWPRHQHQHHEIRNPTMMKNVAIALPSYEDKLAFCP